MSERYTKVFSLENNLYSEGLPVIVSAGVLLKDNINGSILGQLKYKNVTNKKIKSISIELELFDNVGRALNKTVPYQYLDLSVDINQSFGSNSAIPIDDNAARSFKIKIKEIAFFDNTVWENDGKELMPLPKGELLSKYYNDDVLLGEYKTLCGGNSTYVPKEFENLWLCTCGEINPKGVRCSVCHQNFGYVQDSLENAKKEKIKHEEEAKRREEERKRVAEERAKELAIAKKKTAKIAKIVVPILVAVVAFLIILFKVIIPNINYNNAIKLKDEGKYEEAISAFEAMNGYKDSNEQINVCKKLKKNEIEGKQFEGLKNINTGDTVKFGFYEQDNNQDNGQEEIEWLVLDKQGNKAMLISKYGLDYKKYNEKKADVTWETCTLRKWLNNEFINEAFTDEQKNKILTTYVKAEKNPEYDTNPGNDTEDKIFLLSVPEVEWYFKSNDARQCKLTSYADSNGAHNSWWLRSPGNSQNCAALISYDGSVFYCGTPVDISLDCVRPALWVNLE